MHARTPLRIVVSGLGCALTALPVNAQAIYISQNCYSMSIDVSWELELNCPVVPIGGQGAASASALLLGNGCCTPTIQQPVNSTDSTHPISVSASQSDMCIGGGECYTYGGAFSASGSADCDSGHISSDMSINSHYATGNDVCDPCLITGSGSGRASVSSICEASDPECIGTIESFSITVSVSPNQVPRFRMNYCPESAGGTKSLGPNPADTPRGFTSITVSWGDSGGETGRQTHQGYYERRAWSTNVFGSLFDDGGSGQFGPGVPQPAICPPDSDDCAPPAFGYSGQIDVDIPVSIPPSATWVRVGASTENLNGFSNDVNSDGVVDYWDRKAVGDLFGTALGDEAFDPAMDLDGDMGIDTDDAAVLDVIPCIADVDGDMDVDLDDLNTYSSWFTNGNMNADLDGNGVLNTDDLDAFVTLFLVGC